MDDLKANTEYSGYSIASPVIQWFWEIVQGFSKEDKARFLQFVTGTSKVCWQSLPWFLPHWNLWWHIHVLCACAYISNWTVGTIRRFQCTARNLWATTVSDTQGLRQHEPSSFSSYLVTYLLILLCITLIWRKLGPWQSPLCLVFTNTRSSLLTTALTS